LIARGTLTDTNLIARTNFPPSIAELVERMRQGRAYVNLHTTSFPGGEVRGQIIVIDREPVSHYSDPEFSWRYEVAPAAVGFVKNLALGSQYYGDMIVGAARDFLQGGTLFRFNLGWERGRHFWKSDDDQRHFHDFDKFRKRAPRGRSLVFDDPRLRDRVADNNAKYDITESESLLFGTNFGVVTDIQTSPDGKLYLVSLTKGAVYSIERQKVERPGRGNGNGHQKGRGRGHDENHPGSHGRGHDRD
jgi:hypothetical protein